MDLQTLTEEGRRARDTTAAGNLAERSAGTHELCRRSSGCVDRAPLGFSYSGGARAQDLDRALELGPPGTNVAWFTASPRLSGYASAETVKRLEERPFLVDQPRGRGHVVMYVEDPNFRLFWYGLNRIFLNSIFFLPSRIGG
jgi:hypothetical protein